MPWERNSAEDGCNKRHHNQNGRHVDLACCCELCKDSAKQPAQGRRRGEDGGVFAPKSVILYLEISTQPWGRSDKGTTSKLGTTGTSPNEMRNEETTNEHSLGCRRSIGTVQVVGDVFSARKVPVAVAGVREDALCRVACLFKEPTIFEWVLLINCLNLYPISNLCEFPDQKRQSDPVGKRGLDRCTPNQDPQHREQGLWRRLQYQLALLKGGLRCIVQSQPLEIFLPYRSPAFSSYLSIIHMARMSILTDRRIQHVRRS